MGTEEKYMFCSSQMGGSESLLLYCFVLNATFVLSSQELHGSSDNGYVPILVLLQKHGLIYGILLPAIWLSATVFQKCIQVPVRPTHPKLLEFVEVNIFNTVLGNNLWTVSVFIWSHSTAVVAAFSALLNGFPASATLNDHGIHEKAGGNDITVPTNSVYRLFHRLARLWA